MVSKGNIRNDFLNKDGRAASMPLLMTSDNGSAGMIRRQCTAEYKIQPILYSMRVDLRNALVIGVVVITSPQSFQSNFYNLGMNDGMNLFRLLGMYLHLFEQPPNELKILQGRLPTCHLC